MAFSWERAYSINDEKWDQMIVNVNYHPHYAQQQMKIEIIVATTQNEITTRTPYSKTIIVKWLNIPGDTVAFNIGIPQSIWNDIHSYVNGATIFGDAVTIQDPALSTALLRLNLGNKPNHGREIIQFGDENLMVQDTRVLKIGRTYQEHLYYMETLYTTYRDWVIIKMEQVGQLDPVIESAILTMYIGSSLIPLRSKGYEWFIQSLKGLVLSGKVLLLDFTEETLRTFTNQLEGSRIITTAFLALGSLSKVGTKSEFIKQWIDKRLPALFSRVGQPPPVIVPDMSHDLQLVGRFLDDNVELRSILYSCYIYKKIPEKLKGTETLNMYIAIQSQCRLVLDSVELTTYKLSLHFAQECETEVHTLTEILNQKEHLEEVQKKISDICKDKNYTENYYYVFNSRMPELDLANYPDIAYCAVSKQKTLGASSWKNYDMGEITTKISPQTLLSKLGRPLLSTGISQEGLDPRVVELLAKMGKKVDSKLTAPVIFFQPPTTPHLTPM